MAKTPRGKHSKQQGAKGVLRIFQTAGVTRGQLAADARRTAKAAKKQTGGQS